MINALFIKDFRLSGPLYHRNKFVHGEVREEAVQRRPRCRRFAAPEVKEGWRATPDNNGN